MSAMSGGQASYYLGLAREDYYLEGGEPPGIWFGKGAERLGLADQVEPNHLYNLFDGLSPDGSRSLIQNQRHDGKAEHRPGWDLTFSASKSVSVLWSQSSEETRRRIQAVHDRAVRAALRYLEDTATSTRRGKRGERLEKVGLVVATFEHSTSRALDPQLHTHALAMNLSVRDDGTTGTLSSLELFLSKMAAGALYRVEFAYGLQCELALLLRRERSWFEVGGVSEDLVKCFSKRREEIESALAATGLSSAEASAVAALQTRSAKQGASRAELFSDWRKEGASHGWSETEAQRLLGQPLERIDATWEIAEACSRASGRLTQNEAFFAERDFVRHVAEEAQCRSLSAYDVLEGASHYLRASPDIVRLGEHRGEERFSTVEMVELEGRLLRSAQALHADERHQLRAQTLIETFSRDGSLSEEQLKAVWHVGAESGAIAVVSGMAGTGKTRMLEMARKAWEAEGFEVKGATLAARAAKELSQGAGIGSQTIAKLLLDLGQGRASLGPKTVLVVDEAGMVATPDMARLLDACERAGSKLVLVGDERQLQPIGPGAPFKELGVRHGRCELREVRRQTEEWAREAVADMADGCALAALKAFAERGLVIVGDTRAEAMLELVRKWSQDGGRPEDALILAGTRGEAKALNRHVQGQRRGAGELGEPSVAVDGERIHLNDRVMFTKNRRGLGVENGARGTVCHVSGDGSRLGVRLDSGDRITVDTEAFPHLTLGYASTTHKAQGATVQRAYVLGGGAMQGRELAYVQASRARVETTFFATVAETGDDVAQLAREMSRSRQKDMAIALIRVREPDISF